MAPQPHRDDESAKDPRIHGKPIGLLDIDDFFTALEAFFDFAADWGFIKPEHRDLLRESDPDRRLDRMAAWTPRSIAKWTEVPVP